MTQNIGEIEGLVRTRIRALRLAHGWSLGDLAARARMSASTLSRIEGGGRRLALDQLIVLARALNTSLDELVDAGEEAVVMNPTLDASRGSMHWPVRSNPDLTVIRQRLTTPPVRRAAMRAHAGHEWFVVLSGTATLLLGERRMRIEKNQVAEFSTMLPHAMGTESGPCEVLGIFDREARRQHADGAEIAVATEAEPAADGAEPSAEAPG